MLKHYTIDYRLAGSERLCVFHTYAIDSEQAVQDLYDNVPDVESGNIAYHLPAPHGARRPSHDQEKR